MKFRKLRIAFSLVCGIFCLSLVALWVRSGWWQDALGGLLPGNRRFSLSAAYGRVRYATFDKTYDDSFTGFRPPDWHVTTSRIDSPPSLTLVNTPLADFGLGFAGSSDRYGIVAVFPIWVAVIALATLGAVPWLRWRFSLRMLLLAVTLAAVGLGTIAWAVR